MPKYRITVDVYEDTKSDGSELGDFRCTDDNFVVRAANAEAAAESAGGAIVAEYGHSWLVRSVDVLGTEAKEGEALTFVGGAGPVSGTVTLTKEYGGDEWLNVVSGSEDDLTSWALVNGDALEVSGTWRAGESDEFYDHDNIPFPGEVIEVDADGVLYVSSRKLTKHVWVDPITMRITENSVYDWA